MDNHNQELDALMEALTISSDFEAPKRPHYYYNGNLWDDWWSFGNGKADTVYRNADKKYHRIHGPAHVSTSYDFEAWYKDGKFHRTDGGPAYRHKKSRFWFKEGKLHRLDGPAVDANGHPKEYWIGGQKLSPKEYKKEIARRQRKGLIK